MCAAGELRGFDSPHNGRRRAEAAFSVEKPFQRDGIGSELVRRIVRAARNRRITTLYMTCLAQNRAMQNRSQIFARIAFRRRIVRCAPSSAGADANLVVERGDGRHRQFHDDCLRPADTPVCNAARTPRVRGTLELASQHHILNFGNCFGRI